jgi:TetR/AcrR family transcriptional repressor of nem operon
MRALKICLTLIVDWSITISSKGKRIFDELFMKENIKNKILETGAEIIHLKGFNHTGIQEILNAAGVPKGSFYHYFKNKEDFGLQVIDYFTAYFSLSCKDILEDAAQSPLEKIRQILQRFIEFFRSKDCAYGCPIGNLSQEMGDLSSPFQARLKEAMDSMVEMYADIIREGQKSAEISPRLDAKKAAEFLVSSWEGALLHMKIEKSLESLENHQRFIFEYILKP